ncbi:MAG: hypothetical protein Q8M24_12070 [Pseudolabrys sp.]|nr:hypothetical protein [Pseudolabrys sp.]MDP2296183.1 hypothetical protein [Pseudolabrys sp.]
MAGISTSKVGIISSYKAVMARQSTYWSKIKANRESLGSAMSQTRSTLASVSTAFASAQADRISGLSNLAAQAGLDRINAARKAQSETMLKQIDGAQASIDKAKIEAELKQRYYVYTLPAVQLVDTEA